MCYYWNVSQYPWKCVTEFHNSVDDSLEITNVESSIKLQYASTQIRSHTLVNLSNWFALQTNLFVFILCMEWDLTGLVLWPLTGQPQMTKESTWNTVVLSEGRLLGEKIVLKVKVKRWSSPWNRPQRPRGGVEVYLYSFFNLSARWGWVVNAMLRPLYPRERPGIHCTRVWVGPRAGLDRGRKSRRHHDLISGLSSP